MAVEEPLVLRSDTLERSPSLSTVSVGAETNYQPPEEVGTGLNDEYGQFFLRVHETFSKLEKFSIGYEIARVRLMTGDFVGIDYVDGTYGKPIDYSGPPESVDDQKAERLLWIAALASVSQKGQDKVNSPNPKRPREVKAFRKIRAHDKPLVDIAHRAIALHFALRTGRTSEEIAQEVEAHFNGLIEVESHIHQHRQIYSGGVYVKNKEDKAEVEKRFEHSLHRKRKLQATLRSLHEGKIALVS